MSEDTISRQAAIDALWKALYEYEDKTEKQFQESDELDVGDWMQHRIFVQNMSDIDRQTILALPSAERKKGKWIGRGDDAFECSECHAVIEGDEVYWRNNYFCYHCGAKMERQEE